MGRGCAGLPHGQPAWGSTGFTLTSTRMSAEIPSGSRSSQMASALRVEFSEDRTAASRARSSRSHRAGRRVPISLTAVSIRFVADL